MPNLSDFLSAYRGREAQMQAEPMQQLQQVGALQGILSKAQSAQREQALRGVLSSLPPDATPDQVVKAIRPYASADDILKITQAAADRKATLEDRAFGRAEQDTRMRDLAAAAEVTKRDLASAADTTRRDLSSAQDTTRRDLASASETREREMQQLMLANRQPRPEPSVTPVTIQDPNDPSATIVIDGRTRQVLGKGPKMTQAGAIDAKTNLQMTGLGADLKKAEDLLLGVTRTSDGQVVKGNLPTGSGLGSIYDAAAGFVGVTPAGAAEADSLKTVAARLVSRIPRFEGPQSDKDVKLYQQAAGDAGNEKLPRGRRLAAIKTMSSIYEGYESGSRGRLIGNRRSGDGAADEPPEGAVRRRGG